MITKVLHLSDLPVGTEVTNEDEYAGVVVEPTEAELAWAREHMCAFDDPINLADDLGYVLVEWTDDGQVDREWEYCDDEECLMLAGPEGNPR